MAIDTPDGNLSLKIKEQSPAANKFKTKHLDCSEDVVYIYILVNSETLANNFFAFIMFGFKVICLALVFILKLIVCSILVIQTILSSYFIAS